MVVVINGGVQKLEYHVDGPQDITFWKILYVWLDIVYVAQLK